MAQVTEYKCPGCGAPLEFTAQSGNVTCHSCGNEYSIEAIRALHESEATQQEFDWGDFKANLNAEPMEDVAVFTCESCGAEIEADHATAATKCPYCGNNVILNERVSAGLKPNAVIPFKIAADQLPELLQKFYKKKRLLPRNFFAQNKIGKVQGVYVPFWLFDSKIDGSVTMNGVIIRHYTEGDYDCTETNHFLLVREGDMAFSKIPVDASVKMPDDLMDSIEPFDYSAMVPYDSAYLAGFLADRFDSDPDAELPRANGRMQSSAVEMFTSTAALYTPTLRTCSLRLIDPSVRYVMLPVYLLNCEYGGKTYRYAVNGQTGKVAGELPISKAKSAAWFFGVAAGAAAVAYALISLFFA